MTRRITIVISVGAPFSALLTAALLWRARMAEEELRSQIASQAECLARESILCDRLRVALKTAGTDADKSTLLRLRAEVADLRRDGADVAALKNGLEKLTQEVTAKTNHSADPGPDPSKVRAYWAKDQISPAGYADENAAMQSVLWAITRGDLNSVAGAMDPQAVKELWKSASRGENISEADKSGTSTTAIAERDSNLYRLAEALKPVTGFYLVSDNVIEKMPEQKGYRTAQTDAVFKVYFAGDGATRGLWFKKTNDEWRLLQIVVLAGTEQGPRYDMTLWP